MSWDAYLARIQHKIDETTNQYTATNLCAHAAIYGHDGTPWATTPGFQLAKYGFEMVIDDSNKKTIEVDEFAIVKAIAGGASKSPCEAGVRMCNEKYNVAKHFSEDKITYLGKPHGGACLAMTAQAIVIGIWD